MQQNLHTDYVEQLGRDETIHNLKISMHFPKNIIPQYIADNVKM